MQCRTYDIEISHLHLHLTNLQVTFHSYDAIRLGHYEILCLSFFSNCCKKITKKNRVDKLLCNLFSHTSQLGSKK